MIILVTGAGGFTGRHFIERASSRAHTIIPLSVDLRDKAAVRDAVQAVDFDAVLHLAGISFVGHKDEAAFYTINVIGTTNLLAALAEKKSTKPRCVLIASSANVYGNSDKSPIPEIQQTSPVNHYATSKLAMEHMALTYLDRLPIVVARPFNYTGRGQDLNFIIPKLVDHFAHRAQTIELGNVHTEREYNDVRMVCDAYLALLEHGQAGEAYNVCAGHTHTLQSVMNTLTQLTGHDLEVRINSAFVRATEVIRLCGSPDKLAALLSENNIALQQPSLQDTLKWMLSEVKH